MKDIVKHLGALTLALANIFLLASCYAIPEDEETDSVCYQEEPKITSQQNYPHNLEYPRPIDGEDIIVYFGFTSSYNHTTLIPNWVAYELTAEETEGNYNFKPSFSWDPNLQGSQASREDYSNSGWDKGHMAPRADMKWSEQSLVESYYFPNICPQDHDMNAYDWCTIEKLARRMASEYGSIYIVCGPIIAENKFGTIGDNHVVIPDAFYKALLIKTNNGGYQSIAFVLPNKPDRHPISDYACSVNELEAMLGMDFFYNLENNIEEDVESSYDLIFWNINNDRYEN